MILKAGDLICVAYHHGNLIQEGICAFEQGRYGHVVCSLGGNEIIEADTDGVRWTDLRDYLLRHDCSLLVKRHPRMVPELGNLAVSYWKSQVGAKYSYWGDARLGLILAARLLGFHHVLKFFPDFWKSSHSKFCSELGIKGLQAAQVIPRRYDAGDYSPEKIAKDTTLISMGYWDGKEWS